MYEIGIVHGRFQVLHNEHMKYILEAKKRCKHLIVGITNYDCFSSRDKVCNEDPNRVCGDANPFTYFERYEMLKLALVEAGTSLFDFDIVPFPIDSIEEIVNFVPMDGVFFLTIYDDWGRKKEKLLRGLGVKVEVLYEKSKDEKLISSTAIRDKIRNDREWEALVPPSVYKYIVQKGFEEKNIKNI